MKCSEATDIIYEDDGEPMPFKIRFALAMHILFCGRCASLKQRLNNAMEIARDDFFPEAPDLSDAVMNCIYMEETDEETAIVPGGLSTRGWVIVGFIILFSLTTSFFGGNFINVADSQGSSFLVPVGITIGIVVTSYCALFIGSHLKELSERFRLR
jgi:hypothetical protein